MGVRAVEATAVSEKVCLRVVQTIGSVRVFVALSDVSRCLLMHTTTTSAPVLRFQILVEILFDIRAGGLSDVRDLFFVGSPRPARGG